MSSLTPDAATEEEVRQLLRRLTRLRRKWPSKPALRDLSPQMVEALDQYIDEQGNARVAAFVIAITMMLALQFSTSIHSSCACTVGRQAARYNVKRYAQRKTAQRKNVTMAYIDFTLDEDEA